MNAAARAVALKNLPKFIKYNLDIIYIQYNLLNLNYKYSRHSIPQYRASRIVVRVSLGGPQQNKIQHNSQYNQRQLTYKFYLLAFKMQSRVPNEYKPSFLQNLFSAFVQVPTRRILSDKKLQKQKKINLSLTQEHKAKSTKKIKISNSFEFKATPSTDARIANNTEQFSTLRRGQGMHGRGLNFHPRKINFFNQHNLKAKAKNQTMFNPFQLKSSGKDTGAGLVLYRNQSKEIRMSPKIRIRDKRVASFFDCQLQRPRYNNLNPQFHRSYEKYQASQNSTKNKTENTDKLKQANHVVESLQKRESKIYIQSEGTIRSQKQQIQPVNKTPLKGRSSHKVKTQQVSNNDRIVKQKPISNLFENAMTIQSKDDESSQRSNSDCYSHAIERIRGDDMKLTDDAPKHWDDLRRKSLNANLLKKFQQNNQQISYSDYPNNMDFKKKKCDTEEDPSSNPKKNSNIQNIYKNQNIFPFPVSVSPQKYNKNIQKPVVKTIYQQFTKVNYLGVGRFASVYLCVSSSINFIFAMKEILKFTVKYNSIEQQLQKEIEIQHSCNHPHIINLYHSWADEKKYYLALQFGQETLLKRIEKNYALTEENCLRYVHEVAKGLEYLHQRGIVHRDIKPENILLVNGVAKIADFGWATRIESRILNDPCGTPCYISPQMQKVQAYSYKTDCWSLGVLAYELINGKLNQQYFGRGGLNPAALAFKSSVSKQYKQLVLDLLSVDQISRPSSSEVVGKQIFKLI